MAYARYETAWKAIRELMMSMGFADPGSLTGLTDQVATQMWALASEVGQKLLTRHNWQIRSAEMVIDTVVGTSDYPLPSDFNGFTADASWNHTTRLPVVGSLSEQDWQLLKARNLAGTTFTLLFIIEDDKVKFYDPPSVSQKIVMPYHSRGWVKRADGTRADRLENEYDLVLYDVQLFKTALKLAWYEEKMFDTSKPTKEFNLALAAAKAIDRPGRSISLVPVSSAPLIGGINVPDSGFGF